MFCPEKHSLKKNTQEKKNDPEKCFDPSVPEYPGGDEPLPSKSHIHMCPPNASKMPSKCF